MSTNINPGTNHTLEVISNKLYNIKEQQKSLRQVEKDLKAQMLVRMGDAKLHKDVNGTIKKVSCKLKRIYDRDRLQAVLLKRGLPEGTVDDIINESTRKYGVREHVCVIRNVKIDIQ